MKRSRIFLILALGLTSGTLLVDGLLVDIPMWLSIILAISSAACLIASFVAARAER